MPFRSLRCSFACGLVAVLLPLGSIAAAQEPAPAPEEKAEEAPEKIDFSKLKKGAKIEFKSTEGWKPGVFVAFTPPNLVSINTLQKGLSRPLPYPAEAVRLPAGNDNVAIKPRTFKDVTGKYEIKALLLRVEDKTAILRRTEDGKELAVPLAKLSVADRKYIEKMQAALKPKKPAKDEAAAEADGPPAEAAAP